MTATRDYDGFIQSHGQPVTEARPSLGVAKRERHRSAVEDRTTRNRARAGGAQSRRPGRDFTSPCVTPCGLDQTSDADDSAASTGPLVDSVDCVCVSEGAPITGMRERLEIAERRIGRATARWIQMLHVSCECGRCWCEAEEIETARCPSCGTLVVVDIEGWGEIAIPSPNRKFIASHG